MNLTAEQIYSFYLIAINELSEQTGCIGKAMKKGKYKDLNKELSPYHEVRQYLNLIYLYDPSSEYNCLTYNQVFSTMESIARHLGICINWWTLESTDLPVIDSDYRITESGYRLLSDGSLRVYYHR